ncbi:MAG: hypothetical protein ACFFBU_00745 [Promethearchaeota archaeon]
MVKSKPDYSEYRKHIISLASVMTFLAGFTFTVITLLLTQLPDLSSLALSINFLWQFTLFFLAVLFYLMLFIVFYCLVISIILVRDLIPKGTMPTAAKIYNVAYALIWLLIGIPLSLMFLLWNLIYLALAAAIVWVLIIIVLFGLILRRGQVHIHRVRERLHGEE